MPFQIPWLEGFISAEYRQRSVVDELLGRPLFLRDLLQRSAKVIRIGNIRRVCRGMFQFIDKAL
mgnify:CR=1 FL=1